MFLFCFFMVQNFSDTNDNQLRILEKLVSGFLRRQDHHTIRSTLHVAECLAS
jgi:hypothetical protein